MRSLFNQSECAWAVLLTSCGLSTILLAGCSMGEEMRRIEESKHANQLRDASNSTNLTGDQLFVRSCNTCHPSGRLGMGPRLDKLDVDFPTDESLKKFIRKGKGMMPPQSMATMNEVEMGNLVSYLRGLCADLKEANASE